MMSVMKQVEEGLKSWRDAHSKDAIVEAWANAALDRRGRHGGSGIRYFRKGALLARVSEERGGVPDFPGIATPPGQGFATFHPLFEKIGSDPLLTHVNLGFREESEVPCEGDEAEYDPIFDCIPSGGNAFSAARLSEMESADAAASVAACVSAHVESRICLGWEPILPLKVVDGGEGRKCLFEAVPAPGRFDSDMKLLRDACRKHALALRLDFLRKDVNRGIRFHWDADSRRPVLGCDAEGRSHGSVGPLHERDSGMSVGELSSRFEKASRMASEAPIGWRCLAHEFERDFIGLRRAEPQDLSGLFNRSFPPSRISTGLFDGDGLKAVRTDRSASVDAEAEMDAFARRASKLFKQASAKRNRRGTLSPSS